MFQKNQRAAMRPGRIAFSKKTVIVYSRPAGFYGILTLDVHTTTQGTVATQTTTTQGTVSTQF